jgi:hypothetical protein
MDTSVCLSSRRLQNIQGRGKIDDFDFIVETRHYQCPWFIADFLCPRIARLRQADNTIGELVIETKDPKSLFSEFLSLRYGQSVTINSTNRTFFESLCDELLNEELLEHLLDGLGEEVTKDNVLARLRRRSRIKFDGSREVTFLASHFFEFEMSELAEFNDSVLESILGSAQLIIESEDSLYAAIWAVTEQNHDRFSLVQFVRFDYVSAEVVRQFIKSGSQFLDRLNSCVWLSLGERFVHEISLEKPNPRVGTVLLPKSSSPVNGIVSHLTAKCGGNIHDKQVIQVTASGERDSSQRAANAVHLNDLSGSCYFALTAAPNLWICSDFKAIHVTPTHCSIISYPARPNGTSHPKSWCLERSLTGDDNSRVEIDQRTNNNDVNGSNLIGTWEVKQRRRCRFIRLGQTNVGHDGRHCIIISAFEIYGVVHGCVI